MSEQKYDSYFLMKVDDVAAYVQTKLSFFPKNANFECKEIGDGNLNYVFRVKDKNTGKSIIVKQAGTSLRIDKNMHLPVDRGKIESRILGIQKEYTKDLVPEVYLYDTVMCAMIMEDMVNHTMMRTGLTEHKTFPRFAEDISTFLVNSLLLSSDIVKNHKEKKNLVKEFINPDLCEITEDLVFTEPYNDCNNRNKIFPPNLEYVKEHLYSDKKLHLEVAKLKFEFLNNAQSLLHGDLHTGSIFINQNHTFVFDPEFAFYGPMGYDIGNVIANLFFAWCNGDATIDNYDKKDKFCSYILDTIEKSVDLFNDKFDKSFKENVTDRMAKTDQFMEYYHDTILADSAGYTGLELIRRIAGMAKVIDITNIKDEKKRVRAERILITFGKETILDRNKFKNGSDYIKAFKDIVAKF
jgi:5-methylthioribose kinase